MSRHVPAGYKPGDTYPLGDMPSAEETGGASFEQRRVLPTCGISPKNFRAEPTGEMRQPKKGEWYLSGAIVAAYKAGADFAGPYMIARLVKVEQVPARFVKVGSLPLLLLACLGLLTGCNPFREDTAIMYRDGWGGTTVALPGYNQPMPYGASIPPFHNDLVRHPENITTGWYVDRCSMQWRPQRWVRLGTDINGQPTYKAIYP